jgi:hypothetical protein
LSPNISARNVWRQIFSPLSPLVVDNILQKLQELRMTHLFPRLCSRKVVIIICSTSSCFMHGMRQSSWKWVGAKITGVGSQFDPLYMDPKLLFSHEWHWFAWPARWRYKHRNQK